MQKVSYLIIFIAFVALVATTGMAQTARKVGSTYCGNATINDYACHSDRCFNTTTYINDCDTYDASNCDNFTTHFVICNSSQTCRNTSRRVRVLLR